MYPTSIDGKPSAGGFRMSHQTVRVFRTGFGRSDQEFEEILTLCRETSVFRQGEASHQPEAIEHSHEHHVAVLAEGFGAPALAAGHDATRLRGLDAVDLEPREPLRPL